MRRYYELKRRLLGVGELYDYDRYAPLQASQRTFAWEESTELVLAAYREFHPTLHENGAQFFANAWIDAPVQEGKRGGAFAMPGTPDHHPYLMLNYEGTPRDVMTLAHELGHGVHQMLYRSQGWLHSHTPLTTHTTFRVFSTKFSCSRRIGVTRLYYSFAFRRERAKSSLRGFPIRG